MVDLSALIQAAHGGEAANSLAAQFGLTPEQANAAIEALSPALAQGLQNHMQNPDGLGQIVGHLTDSTHIAAFADPSVAQAPAAAGAGGDLLSQIFGGSEGIAQIVQHIGQQTGINPQLLNQLMPVVASMAAGGVAKTMHDSGFGDLLSQLGGAVGQGGVAGQSAMPGQGGMSGQAGGLSGPAGGMSGPAGGLGAILGSLANSLSQGAQNPGQQGGQPGGFGGLFGGVIGALFRGGAPAAGAPAPGGAPAAGGLDPALVQAGMNALSGLFQSSGTGSAGLQNILAQILTKR